jgi:hypothetical protein
MVQHVAEQLDRPINWKLLLGEAHRHSVLPLLGYHLHQYFWPQIPQEVRNLLTEASRECQWRNLALRAELLRILAILKAAMVPAIPLKGPLLAVEAYGNSALRMYADLDILVHKADLEKARQALEADRYVPSFRFTPRAYQGYIRQECVLPFKHSQRGIPLEIHWSLTEKYLSINLPIDSFWQRSVPTLFAGQTVLAFRAEDLLTYLCIHAAKHQWERLEWLSSVTGIIEAHPEFDWVAVRRMANDSGVSRFVRVTLLLANRLLQTPLPAPFEESTDSAIVEEIVAHGISNLFGGMSKADDLQKRAKWYLFLLRGRERWSDKARIVIHSTFRRPHPSDFPGVSLPSKLSFLYYILRPARLLRTSMVLAWHNWRSSEGGSAQLFRSREPSQGAPASPRKPALNRI